MALSEFISGEKLQMICDVYIGMRASISNPKIEREKYIQLSSVPEIWENPKLIFCYSDTLLDFMSKLHNLKNPFILVSHNGDINISHIFTCILEHPLLISWYAQNVMIDHPKLHFLPIGIANEMWAHGNIATLRRIQEQKSWSTKEDKIYFYFNVDTNRAEREQCKQIVSSKGLSFGTDLQHEEYLQTLAKCKFAICPPGNGIDSHRIWECYSLDVIPIVLESPFTLQLQKYVPCIVLRSWNEFDSKSIIPKYMEYMSSIKKQYLDFNYYKSLICDV
jgi:hypothetical protein